MAQIKKQYTNPVPILYLYRGMPEVSLVSKDIDSATEITLSQQMNEVSTLSFKIPFTKTRKISPMDCEKLVKFEGEYYIIKSIRLDDDSTRMMSVVCQHESVELKGVYCTYLNMIGVSPKEMFDTIVASTKVPKSIDYKWAGTDVPPNKFRHLQTDDEQSVYANLIAMAEVFNGWLEIYTDKNEQKWVYLRTQEIKNNKFIRKGIDMKSLGITYNSEEIFTQLQVFGNADSLTGEKLNIMSVNPTGKSYVENYSYYLAKGIPASVINSEPKYQQLKVVTEDVYTDENDLFEFAKEELAKCCVPQLEADVTMTDLSIYMDNPTEPPQIGYQLICIDPDVEFNISCKITGVERNYSNPANTSITISNVVKYNTLLQDISHTVDKADEVIGDGADGSYVPDWIVKDSNGISINVKLGNLQSTVEIKFNEIMLRVDDFEREVYAEIKLTADNITQTVADNKRELLSKIEQNADSIVTTVSRLDEAYTQINQNTEDITFKVSKGEFGTMITQNASSVKVAWNKISSYAEITSSGLILGDSSTKTYSKIGTDGRMEFKMGSRTYPYRSLMYVGSKTITCTSSGYTTATASLPSMFRNIPDNEIQVMVSIKKVYDSNLSGLNMPYWFGAYASIDDGDVVFEVMSAWRKVKYDGNDNSDWVADFGSPKGGRIDVAYTLIA